jgi:hypothetical protein
MVAPAAPILVHARNTGNGAIRLVWKPGSGGGTPVTYEVFRGVAENDTGVLGATETVALTVDATGGTFTVTFGGVATSAIAANADGATVETAALTAWAGSTPAVDAGDVTVVRTGSVNAYVYTFTWGEDFAFENVSAITASGASLTGGAATAVPVTTAGVSPITAELAAAGYAAGELPWFDTTGATATDYWFAIRAVNADGKSGASNQKHVLRVDNDQSAGLKVNVVKSVAVPTA